MRPHPLTIGVVSPGAMGSALGRAWQAGGVRVLATVDGRSERTRSLAARAGARRRPRRRGGRQRRRGQRGAARRGCAATMSDDPRGCRRTGVSAAAGRPQRDLARDRARARGPGRAAGLDFVDGAISGGPPAPGGDTMLYLSGGAGRAVLAELAADGLRTRVVGCDAGIGVGREDVHRIRLQGHAPPCGPRRSRPRTPTASSTSCWPTWPRSSPERPRRPGAGSRWRRARARGSSARWSRSPPTQGAAGASPELFAGMAAVYARLATDAAGRADPRAGARPHRPRGRAGPPRAGLALPRGPSRRAARTPARSGTHR